jgi:GC-rich sequence DNA-binding factor
MYVKAVYTVFEKEVVEFEERVEPYLRVNNARFDPEAIPARKRVLARIGKLVGNMVRWRRYAGEVYGIGRIAGRAIALAGKIAESGWEVGGEEGVKKVSTDVVASGRVLIDSFTDCGQDPAGACAR